MTLSILNGPVIEAGESLSDGMDLQEAQLVRITCPSGWDRANMSFQISSDGNGYNDLYDVGGHEIMAACGASRAIVLDDQSWWKAVAFLKIRSGTASEPVPQSERREFALAVWTESGPAPKPSPSNGRRRKQS